MRRGKYYHYFVEGEDEEKVIKVLKTELQWIIPGKVQRFNVMQQRITPLRLISWKPGTMVVLVFDTDAGNLAMLEENINVLKKHSAVSGVLCIPQVPNLEGELKRSCNIKQIRELTNSKTNKDFKRDLIMDSNFKQKLLKYQFDLWKFWNTDGIYNGKVIENDAGQIKLNKQD